MTFIIRKNCQTWNAILADDDHEQKPQRPQNHKMFKQMFHVIQTKYDSLIRFL